MKYYSTIKTSLMRILREVTFKDVYLKISEIVTKCNEIVIHSYHLLKLYFIKLYEEGKEFPKITEGFIYALLNSFCINKREGKYKPENQKIKDTFENLIETEYSKLNFLRKYNVEKFNQVFVYLSTTILTCIENNIKFNFFKYLRRYVNSLKIDKKLKKKILKELENEYDPKKEEEEITKSIRRDFLPGGILEDLQEKPEKYLKYMFKLNLYFEENGIKQFQVLPLRTSSILHYIPIDTEMVEKMFSKQRLNLSDIKGEDKRRKYWNVYFKMDNKIFRRKDLKFDYSILTDGYSVSIRFYKETRAENPKHLDSLEFLASKSNFDSQFEMFKRIPELEKLIIPLLPFRDKDKDKKEIALRKRYEVELYKVRKTYKKVLDFDNEVWFPHLRETLENPKVFVDPGKRSLLTMMNDEGDFFSYPSSQRRKELKTEHYKMLLDDDKKKYGIKKLEESLIGLNSRSCKHSVFSDYLKKKNEVNQKLLPLYEFEVFRKYKFRSYKNKQRSEARLLNNVSKTFSRNKKEPIIFIGDWSNSTALKNTPPTSCLGLKRLLKTRFRVLTVNEHLTSRTAFETFERTTGYLKIHGQKKYSLLTYQMENKRKGYFNRDRNACRNIKHVSYFVLKNRTRKGVFDKKEDGMETSCTTKNTS